MGSFLNYFISYEELNISTNDFRQNNKEPEYDPFILSELNSLIKDAGKWINPRACVWITDDCKILPDAVVIRHTTFDCGRRIAVQLRHAEKIAVFIATIGSGTTEKYEYYMAQGDYLNAYFTDELGSIAVEKAMDIIQARLAEGLRKENLNISNRYSPGYCDWHVSEQKKLFSIFPSGTCGVTLSESSLMNPIKSISGFIGIGKEISFTRHGCSLCNFKNCQYRKI